MLTKRKNKIIFRIIICLSEFNTCYVEEFISGERIHGLKWNSVSFRCILICDDIDISDSYILTILRGFVRVATL